MDSKERLQAYQELQLMLADYWHDVDTNWGRNAGDYYTDDAVFESTRSTYRGKKKIQEFYQWRLDRGPRTAAHTFANFRVELKDSNNAVCTWYLLLHAHDGKPIHPAAPPIQIALMTDTCIKGPDGRWRYTYRKFETWFEGGVPTTSPNLG
jgi:ketosteroid isomerase-like protein